MNTYRVIGKKGPYTGKLVVEAADEKAARQEARKRFKTGVRILRVEYLYPSL